MGMRQISGKQIRYLFTVKQVRVPIIIRRWSGVQLYNWSKLTFIKERRLSWVMLFLEANLQLHWLFYYEYIFSQPGNSQKLMNFYLLFYFIYLIFFFLLFFPFKVRYHRLKKKQQIIEILLSASSTKHFKRHFIYSWLLGKFQPTDYLSFFSFWLICHYS